MQMGTLIKNSKAILSAISLVLLSYAGASASFGGLEHHNAVLSAPVHSLNGHGALNRVSSRTRKAQAPHEFAIEPVAISAPSLPFAGLALLGDMSNPRQSSSRATSARAPPIS
jgi:hypothetical protein